MFYNYQLPKLVAFMTSTRKYPVKGNRMKYCCLALTILFLASSAKSFPRYKIKSENFDKDWILELESLIDQRDQHNEKRGHFRNTRLPSIDKENSENWIKETEVESPFQKWWEIIMDSIKSKEKRRSENVLSTL